MSAERILITGSAGFIGSALSISLLENGNKILGIDNHNDYYDPTLKEARLARHIDHPNYRHHREDITNFSTLDDIFHDFKPHVVINLAAQVGVQYSLINPQAYIHSNLTGFGNILEVARKYQIKHLIYASSSSVYGANSSIPFNVDKTSDHPISLYAATKKSNELMAHSYSYLYGIPTTGLRFFTVYGPWGRPDMAPMKFTKSILEGNVIKINNFGDHQRDFTLIDDIIDGVIKVVSCPSVSDKKWDSNDPKLSSSHAPWRIFNIGSGKPIKLMDFLEILEKELGLEAKKDFISARPGDMHTTYADMNAFEKVHGKIKTTDFHTGIKKFIDWYKDFYKTTL